MLVQCTVFLIEKNLNCYHIGRHFKSTEISASAKLNALEEVPVQFMPLQKLSGKMLVSVYAVAEIKQEIPFSSLVLHK